MSEDKMREPDFVRQVRDNTSRYLQELLDENAVLRHRVEILDCDKHLLEGKIEALNDEISKERNERQRVMRRIDAMEQLRASCAVEYAIVEEQNNNLASLYTATYSLHGTLERSELLLVIKEIIANLIGSEEMGLYEYDVETKTLELVSSMGIDANSLARIPVDVGIIGESLRRRATIVSDDSEGIERAPHEEGLTACVPLCVDGEIHGAIAVFRLLQHKRRLAAHDRELFDLLAIQAAVALHTSRLHALHVNSVKSRDD